MRPSIAIVLGVAHSIGAAQTICIDPGHPSEVGMGTRGKQLREVDFAWKVANEMAARLKLEGYRVVLTKKRVDEKVLNPSRAAIANKASADLMVRLHCDAGTGSGYTVYYPRDPGNYRGKRGPSESVRRRSGELAKAFFDGMKPTVKLLRGNGVKTDRATKVGKQHGALIGSIYAQTPVLLVEMCVLQNPKDEKIVATEAGRRELVFGLVAGIRRAVPVKSPH